MRLSKAEKVASRFRSNPVGSPALYTEAEVFAGAGVTSGVTPGVRDRAGTGNPTYSTDYGINPGDGSTQVGHSAFTPFNVTAAADFTGAAGWTVTGAGTTASPYLIQNCLIYQPTGTSAMFTWNDTTTATPYHIKFKNCAFVYPDSGVNMINVIDSAGGTLTFEDCQLGGGNGYGTGVALVKVVDGSVTANRCFITNASGWSFWTAGATASITVNDSMFNTTGGPWPGAFSAPALFYNSVAGGTITCTRTTIDHKNAAPLLEVAANCTATFTRVLFNSSDSTAITYIIPTTTGTVPEAWTSGLTMTDCRFYSGNSATMFGWNTINDNQTVRNWEITHCDFIVSGARMSGQTMIALGDGNAGATGTCDDVNFRWCRFSRPQATGIVAGNEVLYLAKASNCTIECCWVDKCGEDAYEFAQPFSNCSVIYCGGGEVSGSYIGGNVVDFYGAFGAAQASAAWDSVAGNTGGHECHHIWGQCTGDAVIVDCVHGVSVHHIDVTNDLGTPFVQAPPAANVRLHWRSSSGTPSLNGVVVSNTLTAAGESYGTKPSELTYETGSDTYATGATAIAASTLTWQEWNGSGWDARGCQHGIVDNMG